MQGSILNFFYLPYFVVTPHEELKSTFLANPVYWSLFFELFANIAFIFTIRLSKINLLLITILLGCWLGLEGHIFHTSPGWSTNNFVGGFPRVGYSFMVGVLIFKYFDLLKALPKLSSLVIVALFVLIAVVPNKNWLIWYFPVIFIIPFIVITGARVEIENSFINKILEYLGWISYPLYCLHFPIISIWRVYSPNPAHFYKELIILLPLTFLITHLVAKKLDDPVRDWLTKKNRKIVVVKSFS